MKKSPFKGILLMCCCLPFVYAQDVCYIIQFGTAQFEHTQFAAINYGEQKRVIEREKLYKLKEKEMLWGWFRNQKGTVRLDGVCGISLVNVTHKFSALKL